MELIFYNLAILIVAYLLGSINTSIIVSKIMIGDDIRNHGSGNAGATNTLRTVGKKGALFVVLGDVLKTVIAIVVARLISPDNNQATYIAGIGAVLGHNFPVYFKFRGGKGIIVSTVAMLFADSIIGLFVVIISIGIMAASRYVSLGSISGAVLFVVFSIIFHGQTPDFIVFALILAVLAIYMHRGNIKRLLSGTENKLSFGKKN
ncbi:MAG: glycerol-3-phosphate 1-O-acyltransferase PlsY [Clostridia bacterium]|nr:glycerol-3-phosphate 1-O-acyltransferase PlsY [Clostridia bacterium]